MSMKVVGRILSLKPDGGVSSCEIYYFHILMFASEGLRVDVHNFEILITVGIFFNINESLMYATFFQKCETLPTPHPPAFPPPSSQPFQNMCKTLPSTECTFLQCSQFFLMTIYINLGNVENREFLQQYK